MRVVKVNFYQDFVEHCRTQLEALGYKTSDLQSDDLVHAFLNFKKRTVSPLPRNVVRSKEFPCPSKHLSAVQEIERKIECGEDLYPHLSRKIKNLKFNDPMLNDWGIHHLHLANVKDADGFVSRDEDILFVRFDQETAYLIGVYDHRSWSKKELVQIIHSNWPKTIEKCRARGAVGLERPVSDASRGALRKAGISGMVDLGGGVVNQLLGGGYSANGLSTEVAMKAYFLKRELRDLQQGLFDDFQSVRNQARQRGYEIPRFPEIKLIFRGGRVFAYEPTSQFEIPLGTLRT